MRFAELEAGQRAREYFHGLRVLAGAWAVVRVDGRGFSRLTEDRFEKPFDPRFSEMMAGTAEALLGELGGRFAYTESDEISVLLDPGSELFGRSVEKLVSVSAGVASSVFTLAGGALGHFDSRVWVGASAGDVVDYFAWRQGDATRCALNGWCYWTLRKAGESRRAATTALDGLRTAEKNELLFRHGINFNDVPAWPRRGVGLWWESYEKVTPDGSARRRRVRLERELPMKEDFRALVAGLLTPAGATG